MKSIDKEQFNEIYDLCYTIRNATLIADILMNLNKNDLLPTILEYICEQGQHLAEYCKDGDS